MGTPFRLLEPTPGFSPGAEHDDEVDRSLSEMREAVTEIDDDDPYASVLRPPCGALLNALEKARRFAWDANDVHVAKMRAASTVIRGQQTTARAAVVGDAFWGVQGNEDARSAAARDVASQAARAVSAEIVTERDDDASGIAQAYVDAHIALCTAFDRAYRDWDGPSSLSRSNKFTLEDLYGQASLESEMRAQPLPATRLREQLAGLVEDDDEEKLALFLRAARVIAVELRDTPPARIVQRFDSRDQATEQRQEALLLLRDLDRVKLARRPDSLEVAGNVIGVGKQLATDLFGATPRFVTPSEYAIRNIPTNAREIEARTRPWSVDRWIQRWLPPSRSPSGWSPIVSRTKNNAPIRAPKGA